MILWVIQILKRSFYINLFRGGGVSHLAFAWNLAQYCSLRVVLPDLWTVCKLKSAAHGSYSLWSLQLGLRGHLLRRAWFWQQNHVLWRWPHLWQLVKKKVLCSSEPSPFSFIVFFC